jgi:hypothetical protein
MSDEIAVWPEIPIAQLLAHLLEVRRVLPEVTHIAIDPKYPQLIALAKTPAGNDCYAAIDLRRARLQLFDDQPMQEAAGATAEHHDV